MRQVLLQNASVILLQNATIVYLLQNVLGFLLQNAKILLWMRQLLLNAIILFHNNYVYYKMCRYSPWQIKNIGTNVASNGDIIHGRSQDLFKINFLCVSVLEEYKTDINKEQNQRCSSARMLKDKMILFILLMKKTCIKYCEIFLTKLVSLKVVPIASKNHCRRLFQPAF